MQVYSKSSKQIYAKPVIEYYKYGNKPNALLMTGLTNANGIVTGFAENIFCVANTDFYPSNNTWELRLKIITGSDVTTRQMLNSTSDYAYGTNEISIEKTSGKFALSLSTDGATGDIAEPGSAGLGTYAATANTTYLLKEKFTGTAYQLWLKWEGMPTEGETLDDEGYLLDVSVASTTPVLGYSKMIIGNDHAVSNYNLPFLGAIDFNGCSLTINNKLVWNGTIAEKSTSLDYDFTKLVNKAKVQQEDKTFYYKYNHKPNAFLTDGITDNNGVISGFDVTAGAEQYGLSAISFFPGDKTWEFDLKVTTGNDITTDQYFYSTLDYLYGPNEIFIKDSSNFGFNLCDTPDPSSYTRYIGTYTVLANTTYWLKFLYDGLTYQLWYSIDGSTYIKDIDEEIDHYVLGYGTLLLGCDNTGTTTTNFDDPFLGSIDMNEFQIKIDDKVIWRGIEPELSDSSDYDFSETRNTKQSVKSNEYNRQEIATTKPNVLMLGSLTENNGVVSGFSSTAFCTQEIAFFPADKTWEMNFKIITGTDISSSQDINGISARSDTANSVCIYNGKFEIVIKNAEVTNTIDQSGSYSVQPNTVYYLKALYTGTNYQLWVKGPNDNDYIKDIDVASDILVYGYNKIIFGNDYDSNSPNYPYAFKGSIDFKECNIKIDNKVIWNGTITDIKSLPNQYIS